MITSTPSDGEWGHGSLTMSGKYPGPDQSEIDEINSLPDDEVFAKELERRRASNAWKFVKVFAIFLTIYFGGGSLYAYVVDGVLLDPAVQQYKLGHIPEANSELDRYLHWGGTNSAAHYYLGMCYYNEGRKQDALNEFYLDVSGKPVRNQEIMHINERSKKMIEAIE